MAERTGAALPKAQAWRHPVDDRVTLVQLDGYGKQATQDEPNIVANEVVAFRIGTLLGLPMVPGAPMLLPPDHRQVAWVSLAYDADVSQATPSVDPGRIAADHPEQAAGTVVFDLLIANHDRHRRNLVYRRKGRRGDRLGLFDHDHALWGNSGLQPDEHLNRVKNNFMLDGSGMSELRRNRHCLLDHLNSLELLDRWCERAGRLVSDPVLEQICHEAVDLPGSGLTKHDAKHLYEILRVRRMGLQELIDQNLDQFPGVDADGRLR